MKAIIIREDALEQLFEKCFDKLKLHQFTVSQTPRTDRDRAITEGMYGLFHYEVCRLKDAIKDGSAL